jgi:hypothetical protein
VSLLLYRIPLRSQLCSNESTADIQCLQAAQLMQPLLLLQHRVSSCALQQQKGKL